MEQKFITQRLLTCIFTLVLLISTSPMTRMSYAQVATATPTASGDQELGPEFVITPTGGSDGDFFEIEMEAGTAQQLSVTLGNADDESLKLITYVADVVPAPNGGFAVAREDVPPIGTAAWVEYPLEQYTFEPGEGVERQFTIAVPEDVPAGQYVAGLVLQTADPLPVQGTEIFTQIIRKVIQIAITIPGPVNSRIRPGDRKIHV